jgi:DNA-binding LacI/PurR family transcriptional regulator
MVNRNSDNQMNRDLKEGVRKAFRTHGRHFNERYYFTYGILGTEGGNRLADRLLKEGADLPQSLVVSDDAIAHGMVHRFSLAGIQVPRDVAVIGFGNLIDPRHIINELTTIDQPAREKGRLAARLLLDLIEHPDKRNKLESVILDPELIIRKSCGCNQ